MFVLNILSIHATGPLYVPTARTGPSFAIPTFSEGEAVPNTKYIFGEDIEGGRAPDPENIEVSH
jgi:hypothetical protein